MTQLTAETLLNLGFRDIAKWVQVADANGIDYRLDGANATADRALLDVRNALYAFVQGDTVNYIGKTARSIKRRFVGYCQPGKTQRTNWRCHTNIRALLKEDIGVRILVFTPISDLRYGDFHIDLAAALEESLILSFSPLWNGREGKRPVTEEAERELTEEVGVAPAGEAEAAEDPLPSSKSAAGSSGGQSPHRQAAFQIKLGSAYYDQGLINPGVDASRHLGEHGDPMIIYLGSQSEQADSLINRTANVNASVRVVGNNRLIAEWFQRNFRLGDVVEARVLDPQHVLLLPPR
jgi:hypothetical protein